MIVMLTRIGGFVAAAWLIAGPAAAGQTAPQDLSLAPSSQNCAGEGLH